MFDSLSINTISSTSKYRKMFKLLLSKGCSLLLGKSVESSEESESSEDSSEVSSHDSYEESSEESEESSQES